ncbi:MAG TPA: rhodanese-like domain-containing protein [Syntrophobacteraceae bacterium]|nr:rhodanese-like domain-containing protein [Syntrophobacteraceae bacterium]
MTAAISKLIRGSAKFRVGSLFLFMLWGGVVTHAFGASTAPDLALIDVSELHENRQAWVILDARPRCRWEAGHVAGAYPFSWEDHTTTDEQGVPFRLRPAGELADALARMGIDEKTPVAVYGDAEESWGGEGWACWVLSWLGHKGPIRLVAGGIQAWLARGYYLSTETDRGESQGIRYRVSLRPHLDIRTSEVQERAADLALIDTRSSVDWVLGHLPGAIHIPWTDFYSGKDRRPLDAAALRKLFVDHGVDTDKPIVYYCAGGVRSGYAWTVHTICGLPPAHNYVAGMEEWVRCAKGR